MENALAALNMMELPAPPEGADVPDWIHLMPKGVFRGRDGRGPWFYDDAQTVIEASFARRRRIHVDENHSTRTAGKLGLSAPARGFITQMEEREDGIWGKVDWTESGRALLADRAYWGVSPVLAYDKVTGQVAAISHAALTNDPALRELLALNSTETPDMFNETLAKMLGLPDEATETEITAALQTALDRDDSEDEAALGTALTEIGTAMGLDGTMTTATIVAAAKGLKSAGSEQGEALASLQAEVDEMKSDRKRQAAEGFVDGAIRDLRAGVKASREEYVSLHMEDPARCEKLVAGLPKLARSGLEIERPTVTSEGEAALQTEQLTAARLLGIDPKDYAKTLEAERKKQEMLQ